MDVLVDCVAQLLEVFSADAVERPVLNPQGIDLAFLAVKAALDQALMLFHRVRHRREDNDIVVRFIAEDRDGFAGSLCRDFGKGEPGRLDQVQRKLLIVDHAATSLHSPRGPDAPASNRNVNITWSVGASVVPAAV